MKLKSAIKSVYKSRKTPKAPSSERLAKPRSTQLDRGTLQTMLNKTYEASGPNGDVGSYVEDKSLSNRRTRVYHDAATNHTVVAHRGSVSKQDWLENALYTVGFRGGRNYKHARKAQRAAESKYGTDNLTTIGHSKGALHAQDFGGKGDIVTLNKPVNFQDALHYKVPKYQTDYRGEGDVVSALRPLQKGGQTITLKKAPGAKKKKGLIKRVLDEHAIDTLER